MRRERCEINTRLIFDANKCRARNAETKWDDALARPRMDQAGLQILLLIAILMYSSLFRMKTRCVFFDRDGIVNKTPMTRYVERLADFFIIPEFVDVLRAVRNMGYEAIVATNQRGVALGIVSIETLEEIHENLRTTLAEKHGLKLLDVLYCPHDEGQCDCRKPQPGMLIEAARRHNIDLKSSWMVGDNEKDVEAGRRAGCKTILVAPGTPDTRADFNVADMAGLKSLLADVLC